MLLASMLSRDQVGSACQHLMQCQGWMQVNLQRTERASGVDLQLQPPLPQVQLANPACVAVPATITGAPCLFPTRLSCSFRTHVAHTAARPAQKANWRSPDFLAGHPLLFAAANWMTAPCPPLATCAASRLAPFSALPRSAARRRLPASLAIGNLPAFDGLLS